MTKNMMNREIAIINLCALCCSGLVAVVLAFKGFSYWSLACQQVVNSTVLVTGRFFFVRWRPSLKIDFTPIRRTWRFAMNILLTMILNTINNNILNFIFGKLFTETPEVVGTFFQAFKWNAMAWQMAGNSIEQVAQPVLVSLRDDKDETREVRVFRKMLRFTALLSFPAMLGLSLVSCEFILATIGPNWIDSVPILRVLCIGGAFMPFYSLYKNLVISQGRSDINMWLNLSQIAIQIVLILLTYQQGILTVVWAYTILNIVWLIVWQACARRMIGIRMTDVLRDTMPFAVISAAVMIVTGLVTASVTNIYLLFFSRIIVAGALYIATMKLLKVKIMDECLNFIGQKLRKR